MKYIFFSDIDGTIYNHTQKVQAQTLKDRFIAKQHHVEFVIATGNGYFNSIKKLANTMDIKYLILSNGSHIYDFSAQKTLYKNVINQNVAQELVDIVSKLNGSVVWWDETQLYFGPKTTNQVIQQINQFIHQDQIIITSQVLSPPLKMEILNSQAQNDSILKAIKHLPLKITRMHPFHVEIVNQNVDKAHGIKVFCQLFNIDKEKIAAVGDSFNDLEMLTHVKHSYAMGNGHLKVKQVARYQTSHVNQNGVGKALCDFINKISV